MLLILVGLIVSAILWCRRAGLNLLIATALWQLHRRRVLAGQLFHVYLIVYGMMRLGHELLRDPHVGPDGFLPTTF